MRNRVRDLIKKLGYRQRKALRVLMRPYDAVYPSTLLYVRHPLNEHESKEVMDIALKYRDIIFAEDLLKEL